jgi:hypothetical protein
MNHHPHSMARLIAALLTITGLARPAFSQPNSPDILPNASQNCSHVMELIHRYGSNASCNSSLSLFDASPFGPVALAPTEVGDLMLCNVSLLNAETPDCGPTIAVTVQNASQREVASFRITAVATLGRIVPTAPSQTIRIEKLCAGETATFPITLPVECLGMGSSNGQPIGFNQMVVCIDSFDQWMESNESNNWLVLKREELIRVDSAVLLPASTMQEDASNVPSATPAPSQNPSSPSIDFETLQQQANRELPPPSSNDVANQPSEPVN